MREAAPLVVSDALHVPVAAIYPLSRIREAVTHLGRGGKSFWRYRSSAKEHG